MKTIFASAIRNGGFDLTTMLARISEYHILGRLTDTERDELTAQARQCATADAALDLPGEIQRLWAAVRTLQGSAGGDVPAFAQPTGAHDAYYAGDRVLFGGAVWTCVAPRGTACVWSPEVMPDWWEAA